MSKGDEDEEEATRVSEANGRMQPCEASTCLRRRRCRPAAAAAADAIESMTFTLQQQQQQPQPQ